MVSAPTEAGIAPFVSVVMPVRNEEAFIAGCVDSLLAMDYPSDRIEIIVVDGDSDDRTREILEGYARRHASVRVVANPNRITPAALNRGIAVAKGDVILRVDAHAEYPPNYVTVLVQALEEHGVEMAGSVMVTTPRSTTALSLAIVAALTSAFGVGNSYFRTGTTAPRIVDTLFGGAYRRSALERVGPFNERLARSQDIELNRRIKMMGGRVLLVPTVSCTYYARSDLRSFLRHNYQNGLWAVLPFLYSPIMPVGWKHLVPLAFVLTGLALGTLALLGAPLAARLFLVYAGTYAIAAVLAAIGVASRARRPGFVLLLPPMFAALHVGYGLGSLVGAVKVLIGWLRGESRGVSSE